ncbi:MAG TPA: amidohydrolase family protein [Candidatus Limnocylindria bacterium]|nr:amidohydrolase family protein [Candidatus Limnocylindria bacterium]
MRLGPIAGDRTLIRGGLLLPMDARYPSEFVGDVLLDGPRIAEVAARIDVGEAARVIDARGKIVTPGLVDTHRHLWQSVLRYVGADWTIAQYARAAFGRFGPHFTPDDMYISVLIGLVEALDAGITQILDWDHNLNTPDHADEVVRAHVDSRARVVLGYGQGATQWLQTYGESNLSEGSAPSSDIERLRSRYYASDESLRTLALAARGPEKAPMSVSEAEWRQARELGLRISVHVGNGLRAFERPIAQLESVGLLGDDTTYVHCSSLADDEIALIAASGGSASCAPEIESNMGHGHPALGRLVAAGVPASLSADTCTNVSGDLFAVMRAALASVRESEHASSHARGEPLGKLASTTYQMLQLATLGGAVANGLGDTTGSLTPGKSGDVVIFSCDAPNMFPLNTGAGTVVKGAHPGNVDTVFVAGRELKRGGQLVDVDLADLRRRAETCRDDLFTRAGVPQAEGAGSAGAPTRP